MFDKERFHNALALSLGYERIVNDKRITIEVDDSNDPWVILKIQDYPETIRIKASDATTDMELKVIPALQEEIKYIVDAVQQAYLKATSYLF